MQIQQLIKKGGILILTLLILTSTATAQDLLKGNNLANVRVDQLSDGDIAKLKSQLSAQGMTIDQAEPIAIAKGRTHCVGEGLKKSSPKKVIQIKKDVKGDRQSFILVKLLMILSITKYVVIEVSKTIKINNSSILKPIKLPIHPKIG